MKRIVLFVCLAAALRMSGLLPFSGHDVAELVPVEALTVDWVQNQVILKGKDCEGRGENWDTALQDLYCSANGTVFLSTAEQVVLSESAVKVLPDVIRSQELRPAAVICICRGSLPNPEEAAKYLSAHNAGVTIQQVQAAMVQGDAVALPILKQTKGGLRLSGS